MYPIITTVGIETAIQSSFHSLASVLRLYFNTASSSLRYGTTARVVPGHLLSWLNSQPKSFSLYTKMIGQRRFHPNNPQCLESSRFLLTAIISNLASRVDHCRYYKRPHLRRLCSMCLFPSNHLYRRIWCMADPRQARGGAIRSFIAAEPET